MGGDFRLFADQIAGFIKAAISVLVGSDFRFFAKEVSLAVVTFTDVGMFFDFQQITAKGAFAIAT